MVGHHNTISAANESVSLKLFHEPLTSLEDCHDRRPHGMDFFRSGYASLVGPTGLPQSASDTIDRLCDRLANTPNVEDKRAALLGLKGLSRDWKGVGLLRSAGFYFSFLGPVWTEMGFGFWESD